MTAALDEGMTVRAPAPSPLPAGEGWVREKPYMPTTWHNQRRPRLRRVYTCPGKTRQPAAPPPFTLRQAQGERGLPTPDGRGRIPPTPLLRKGGFFCWRAGAAGVGARQWRGCQRRAFLPHPTLSRWERAFWRLYGIGGWGMALAAWWVRCIGVGIGIGIPPTPLLRKGGFFCWRAGAANSVCGGRDPNSVCVCGGGNS